MKYCEDCKFIFDRERPPSLWRCTATPKESLKFLVKDEMRAGEWCDHVNTDGECPKFEPLEGDSNA